MYKTPTTSINSFEESYNMAQQTPSWLKLKALLKMSIQRLRYAQEKQQALAKQSRREVARLLTEQKDQKAKYRVESLINDDIHIELLEILELYSELLHARVAIVNNIADEVELIGKHSEDGINEAIRALVFASLHASEIRELSQIKDIMAHKFGLDFLKAIVDDKIGVPEKVLKKCTASLPRPELVELYLQEIANTYEVPYERSGEYHLGQSDSESSAPENNENISETKVLSESLGDKPILAVDNDQLGDAKHPIMIKKPRKNSDTVDQELRIPKDIAKDVKFLHKKEKVNAGDDLEELRKRFAALRR